MNDKRRRYSALLILFVLAASVLMAACGSDDDDGGNGGSGDQALTTVDFQLSWLPGGDNLEFWAGQAEGIYEDHGIDLNIRHTNDPTLSIKLAASGERPMAIAYTGDILFSAAQGSKVRSVFALTESSPFGIVSPADSGIETPQDLVGKRVGVTSLPTDQAFFDNMLSEAGVDKSEVEVVDPGQSGVQQVLQGNLDATSAIEDYEPVVMAAEGVESNFMFYSDYGAPDAPFYCIVVNPEFQAENSDVVAEFVAATQESIEWTNENTDEAVDIFIEQFPEQDPEIIKGIWEKESQIQGDGTNDPEKWQTLADFLLEQDLLEQPVPTEDLYTNEYLE
jgi:ABC-type nitrate/sulfonate/bicarbonate transport system substrate-binding protein